MPEGTVGKWLTAEQLCERLQVPITTVRWWRSSRTGPPAVKIGRFLRYRLSDVEEWETTLEDPQRVG